MRQASTTSPKPLLSSSSGLLTMGAQGAPLTTGFSDSPCATGRLAGAEWHRREELCTTKDSAMHRSCSLHALKRLSQQRFAIGAKGSGSTAWTIDPANMYSGVRRTRLMMTTRLARRAPGSGHAARTLLRPRVRAPDLLFISSNCRAAGCAPPILQQRSTPLGCSGDGYSHAASNKNSYGRPWPQMP